MLRLKSLRPKSDLLIHTRASAGVRGSENRPNRFNGRSYRSEEFAFEIIYKHRVPNGTLKLASSNWLAPLGAKCL